MPEEKTTKPNPFEKLYKRKLSDDEIAEMKHNFFGFMDLLMEIDKEQKETKEKEQND
jgi:hypothetical protein